MRSFRSLSEQEVLALAISQEEEDARIYADLAVALRAKYPEFFWKVVTPYIGDALRYLSRTQEGKLWISNLYSHVFSQEHRHRLLDMES